jgi:hypothetical protein
VQHSESKSDLVLKPKEVMNGRVNSLSRFITKTETVNKKELSECNHTRQKSNNFMTKVQADALARQRGKQMSVLV